MPAAGGGGMYNPPGDNRVPPGPRPYAGQQHPQQPQQPYSQPPQPQQYGQQPQPFGQPSQPFGQSQQPQYGQPPPAAYGQPPQPFGQSQPPQSYGPSQQPLPYGHQPQPYGQAPAPQAYAPSFGVPGMGGVAGAGLGKMGAALPQLSGMPSVFAFGFGIAAVVLALVCDVIFLKVHIPGVGGYAWYLTTALSFAGAGYLGIKWTRATQATAMMSVAVAAIVYGIADLGLAMVLEDLPMGSALFLGIQGLVIAAICGGGGVRKALAERD